MMLMVKNHHRLGQQLLFSPSPHCYADGRSLYVKSEVFTSFAATCFVSGWSVAHFSGYREAGVATDRLSRNFGSPTARQNANLTKAMLVSAFARYLPDALGEFSWVKMTPTFFSWHVHSRQYGNSRPIQASVNFTSTQTFGNPAAILMHCLTSCRVSTGGSLTRLENSPLRGWERSGVKSMRAWFYDHGGWVETLSVWQ